MIIHAVGNRCAVDLDSLSLPLSKQEILLLLEREGFCTLEIDMIALVREYVGRSTYRRCAFMREAPHVVDCASLIKWMYARRGIWLPRDLLLWIDLGMPVDLTDIRQGDLVFTDGRSNRHVERIGNIGHVGIAADHQTMIHATNHVGIEEISIASFLRQRTFCCARRIIPEHVNLITLIVPPHQEIEISQDLEWMLYDVVKSFKASS